MRLLSASFFLLIFISQSAVAANDEENTSITKASFIGHVPPVVSIDGFVNNKLRYYRFTVTEKTRLEIKFTENTQRLYAAVVSMNDEHILDKDHLDPGFKFGPALFLPGDYCLKVRTRDKGQASVFSAVVKAP